MACIRTQNSFMTKILWPKFYMKYSDDAELMLVLCGWYRILLASFSQYFQLSYVHQKKANLLDYISFICAMTILKVIQVFIYLFFSFALHSNSLKLYWLNIGICMNKEQIHAIFVTRKICSTYDLKLVIKIKFCVFLRLMSHFVCIESITIDFIHIPIRWMDFFSDWV